MTMFACGVLRGWSEIFCFHRPSRVDCQGESMGIEYIFFIESFRDRFAQFVRAQGIACRVR